MSDRDIEALASIVVLLFVFIIILCPVIALWVYIIIQTSKRKRIRERILATQANLIGNRPWFPVRYASQSRYNLMFKIVPWDTAGIIVLSPAVITFLGENLAGTPVTLQFAPGGCRLNWLGKRPWPNGAVSWLSFDNGREQHYFTSETGITILGSHKSTREIYDAASRNFGAAEAQKL